MTVNDAPTSVVVGEAREPLLTRGTITAVVAAVLGVAAAAGLHLSPEWNEAILTALVVIAPIAATAWARRHVNSPASTKAALVAARRR